MRTKQPPVQREIDIDLELPLTEPEDGAGFIIAADGKSSFNFFLFRVQLAQIQGRIYDAIHSALAQSLSSHQQIDQAVGLRHRLNEWMSRVPRQFQPDTILRADEPLSCRSFGVLFASHLACRIAVCQTHIMETRWLQTLQNFGREAVRGEVLAAAVPSPLGWQELVSESREYMRLFASIEQKDSAFVWMTACTYISVGVCLIANNMFDPHHENVEYDERLADISFSFLNEMIQQVPYEPLKKTQESYEKLLLQARVVRLQISSQNSYH
ncbi:putative Zn(2)-C6 fungal-type domain-containing protein [Seiridium unicorne]|uniref:Zn(2)-C6 fungal-type domain-containing protein n=1 Tax=Seiridium unicorne TaxID=138068 RepID=A0ABR2V007_9PEZI